jgi:Spy/CpxP family protein refolding chaperone
MFGLAGSLAGLTLLCAMSLPAQTQDGAPASQQSTTQEQQSPRARKMHGHKMFESLNLSDQQKAQIKQIHETTKSQIEALQKDTSLTAEQKQAKMHELRREARRQTSQVLTAEQRKQLRAEIRERRTERLQRQQPAQPEAQPQSPAQPQG